MPGGSPERPSDNITADDGPSRDVMAEIEEHTKMLEEISEEDELREVLSDDRYESTLHLNELVVSLDEEMLDRYSERIGDYLVHVNNLIDKRLQKPADISAGDLEKIVKQLWVVTSLAPEFDPTADIKSMALLNKARVVLRERFARREDLREYVATMTEDLMSEEKIRAMEDDPDYEAEEDKMLGALVGASAFNIKQQHLDDSYYFRAPGQKEGTTEKWTVSIMPPDLVVFRSPDPKIYTAMRHELAVKYLSDNGLTGIVNLAKTDRRIEEGRRSLAKGFDLPKTGKISYCRFFPREFQGGIASSYVTSEMLASVLTDNYGKRLEALDPQFADNVLPVIANTVRAEYDKGTRHFYLDLYSHGRPGYLGFDPPLTADGLVNLIESMPKDATFTISTIACMGGGLREGFMREMQKDPELAQRVDLLLPTKPKAYNYFGAFKEDERISAFGTYNQFFFLQNLLDRKGLGEAAYDASEEVEKLIPIDGEMIIDGKLITELEQHSLDSEDSLSTEA